jgi:hypothetical protein
MFSTSNIQEFVWKTSLLLFSYEIRDFRFGGLELVAAERFGTQIGSRVLTLALSDY